MLSLKLGLRFIDCAQIAVLGADLVLWVLGLLLVAIALLSRRRCRRSGVRSAKSPLVGCDTTSWLAPSRGLIRIAQTGSAVRERGSDLEEILARMCLSPRTNAGQKKARRSGRAFSMTRGDQAITRQNRCCPA